MYLVYRFSATVVYERPKIGVLRQRFTNVNEFFAHEGDSQKSQLVDTPGIFRETRTMHFGLFQLEEPMTLVGVLTAFSQTSHRVALYEEALGTVEELGPEHLVRPILILGSVHTDVDRIKFVPCFWNIGGRSLGLMHVQRLCRPNDLYLGVERGS